MEAVGARDSAGINSEYGFHGHIDWIYAVMMSASVVAMTCAWWIGLTSMES